MVALAETIRTEETLIVPQIAKIAEPLANAFTQLASNTNPRDYDLVIGDEYSGRIPTYVAINALRTINGSSNPRGVLLEPYVGFREFRNQDDRDNGIYRTTLLAEKKIAPIKPQRALFVTEVVETGNTVDIISETLNGLGIKFDVLTLFCPRRKDEQISGLLSQFDASLFVGAQRSFHSASILTHRYQLLGLPVIPQTAAWPVDSKRNAENVKHDVTLLGERIASSLT